MPCTLCLLLRLIQAAQMAPLLYFQLRLPMIPSASTRCLQQHGMDRWLASCQYSCHKYVLLLNHVRIKQPNPNINRHDERALWYQKLEVDSYENALPYYLQ